MAFNAAFTLAKVGLKNAFQLTDTSSGADSNIQKKVVSIFKADGSLLVPAIEWDKDDDTITLDVISDDIAANISVFWDSSSPEGSPSTYTFSQINYFIANLQDFYYNLTQLQVSNPNILSDQNYYWNKAILGVAINDAIESIEYGESVFNSQMSISRGYFLMNNKNFLF